MMACFPTEPNTNPSWPSGTYETFLLDMTNVSNPISKVHALLDSVPAANDDQINDSFGRTTVAAQTATATGWDSYEVWRRFIKEARDRRRSEP